ncbi:hypothetical protein [Thiolapillus sp.]
MFATVFVAVLLLGAILALTRTPQYSYVSVLQIGAAYGSNSVSGKLVEDTDGVVTKLEKSVIPEVVAAWRKEHPERPEPKMLIKGKRNAGIVLIMTRASQDQSREIADLHRQVANSIVDAHKTLVMTQFESFLSQARKERDDSEAKIHQTKAAMTQQQQRKLLLGKQLQRLNAEIESVSDSRQEIASQVDGDKQNAAPFLTQLDLPSMLERRDRLEDDWQIQQNLVLADLQRALSEAQSANEAARKKIDLLQNEIGSLRLTRIQTLAAAMPDKVGLSPGLVMILSVVFALVAAWFAVMFAEYLARASQ